MRSPYRSPYRKMARSTGSPRRRRALRRWRPRSRSPYAPRQTARRILPLRAALLWTLTAEGHSSHDSSRDGLLELHAGHAQAGVDGVQRDTQHLGDLRCGHLLDLVQHQNRPAIHVDGGEGPIEAIERLTAGQLRGLLRLGRLPSLRAAAVPILGVPTTMPARIGGDAKHDLEEPCPGSVAAILELVEAAMGDDGDLLGAVVRLRRGNTEAAKVPPHEVHVHVVHRSKLRLAGV